VAVGTHYDRPIGVDDILPPHEGRVWTSPDGRSWVDFTPPDFADAILNYLFAQPDGSLIAFGNVTDPQRENIEDPGPITAWESADGRSWRQVDAGLPVGHSLQHLARGARGYLAALWNLIDGTPQLWLSPDGRHWEQVHAGSNGEYVSGIGAGDEGFVVVGGRAGGNAPSAFVMASADGQEWVTAASPPEGVSHVVAIGPDWIASGQGTFGDVSKDSDTPVWFSTNGLDWSEVGRIPLRSVDLFGDGSFCNEWVSELIEANRRLVASLTLTGPCSEGAFVSYSRTLISLDQAPWQPLPFPERSDKQPGSFIRTGIGADGGLLLAGQSNGRATFWVGDPN
jgi:hypothetical protein